MAGLWFEEFRVGQRFDHPIRRTITETDNVWFSAITHNPAALHLDEDYCREHTPYGQRVVNSMFTLALMVGISVNDTTLGTTVGNLGMEGVRFPAPVFHGDTLYVESEVMSKRDSQSNPSAGIVRLQHVGRNQRGEVVIEFERTVMFRKRAGE